ncbi:MAG: glycosyltransferase family 2 protein [Myxococcota bacterium]
MARADLARACGLRGGPTPALERVRAALRLAMSGNLERSSEAICASEGSGTWPEPDLERFSCEALHALSVEDLFPELRRPGQGAYLGCLLRLADALLRRGRGLAATRLAAYAHGLGHGLDRGMGLDLIASGPSAAPLLDPGDGRNRLPEISVIVPTLDRPALLWRALSSLEMQTFRNFEVIVVNDGGEDPAPLLGLLGPELSAPGRLTFVQHPESRGLSAARNSGLRAARAPFVSFLDDDDRVLPSHLSALLPSLRQGAEVAFADSRQVGEDPDLPLPRTRGLRLAWSQEFDRLALGIDNFRPVQSFLCRRDRVTEVGGFDESLPVLEDWDLWLRLLRHRDPVRVPRVTSEVRTRSDGGRISDARRDCWPAVMRQIYDRTLDLEAEFPGLDNARRVYLERRVTRRQRKWPPSTPTGVRSSGSDLPLPAES